MEKYHYYEFDRGFMNRSTGFELESSKKALNAAVKEAQGAGKYILT